MDCRKNIWPIENTTIFSSVTAYLDANDVEEQPESVCFVENFTHASIIQKNAYVQYVDGSLELHSQLNCLQSILIWVIFPFWSSLSLSSLALTFPSATHSIPFRFPFNRNRSERWKSHEQHTITTQGCYVSGLYIEGAGWSFEHNTLVRSNNLQESLPILRVLPMERHKLMTQVWSKIVCIFLCNFFH